MIRADAARGDRDVALGEHLEREGEHLVGRLEVPVEQDAAVERAEEGVDEPVAEAPSAQPRVARGRLLLEQLVDRLRGRVQAQLGHAQLVAHPTHVRRERGERVLRTAHRVRDPLEPPSPADQRARIEGAQIQARVVEVLARGRVGLEQDLEATVEQEPVDPVGAHAPARAVRGLQDEDVSA